MMDAESFLDQYRAVRTAANRMLAFARENRWAEVAHTAIAIGGLTDRLRRYKASELLDANQMYERGEILADLVQIDDQVRQLRDPWVRRLDAVLAPGRPAQPADPMAAISLHLD